MSKLSTLLDKAQDYINALDIARRAELAKFIGVKPQTIRAYLRSKSLPTGRRLLQLHHILVWAGYDDHLWKVTNDNVELTGSAFTFGLISDESLLEAFDGECDVIARIIQMMNGGKHISPASQEIFDLLASVHSWNIKAAQDKRHNLKIVNEKDKLIAELANKFKQLLPLVEEISGDGWTADERSDLRNRAGDGIVLELYNQLGYLCGERHRKLTMAEKAQRAAASMLLRR